VREVVERLRQGRPGWHDRAACLDQPVSWFFSPGPGVGADPRGVALCDGCEVRLPCGGYAEYHAIIDGTWGGVSEADRKKAARAGRGREDAA
jgi:WhiB family transcriptional regulator, redox-sensing transcriptional regulator